MAGPTSRSPDDLRRAWAALRERRPGLRARYAAAELGVSEGELLATRIGEGGVRRIEPDLERILPRLEAVGPLMALTRNDLFVHEKTGVYRNVYPHPHVSSVAAERIDLRIFTSRWVHGFAAEREREPPRGPLRSLQFFDAHGTAVHKIFLREASDEAAWDRLVDDLVHADQEPGMEVSPVEPPPPLPPDEDVDVRALEADWRELTDTHDFLSMLRAHGVGRVQALRLVDDELARPAGRGAVRRVLETAAGDGVPIMVFVRSPGTIQIHHGPVQRVRDSDGWLNVLDPDFQLHVREPDIAGTWVVRKPVEDGWVTSVEVYDAADTLCALFFGVRGAGEEEDAAWRALARGLP